MQLDEVMATECTLPSLPRAVALLANELAQSEPSLRRINQFFLTDPALAARLLREVNAHSHPLSGKVAGIPEALVLLDIVQLRSFVGAAFLGTTAGSVPGMNLQHFWRYSINTARLARSLAGIARRNQTAAYTAGLLHGLGELVLHLRDPLGSNAISRVAAPLDWRRSKAEKRSRGYGYASVSAALARQWRLPNVLVDAMRYHSAPFEDEVYEPLAAILHLAVWRARAREARFTERELAATFPGEVGVALNMDIDTVMQQDPIDWKAQPNIDDSV